MVPVTVDIEIIGGWAYRWHLRSASSRRLIASAPWAALALTEAVARTNARLIAEARGNPVAE